MHKAHSAGGYYFVHDVENGGILGRIFCTLDEAQDAANRCLKALHSSQNVEAQAAELLAKLLAHNLENREASTLPGRWPQVAAERRKLIQ